MLDDARRDHKHARNIAEPSSVSTLVKLLAPPVAVGKVVLARRGARVRLGDVVAAAVDEAARVTSDPRRAAELAAEAVALLLAHAGRTGLALRLSAGLTVATA